MNRTSLRVLAYVLVLVALPPAPAHANVGVPMLFITLPLMLMALVPIIVVEGIILRRGLQFAPGPVFRAISVGNLVSTLLGIPLTWILLVLVQMLTGGGGGYGIETARQKLLAVTWQAPWLIPYERELHWMVPAATLVLLVPFFFASWLVEYGVAKAMLPEINSVKLKRGVIVANLVSYSLLGLLVFGWFLSAKS